MAVSTSMVPQKCLWIVNDIVDTNTVSASEMEKTLWNIALIIRKISLTKIQKIKSSMTIYNLINKPLPV